MKRDINLLPSKKADPKRTTNIIVVLMVLFLYILIFGLGIIIPRGILQTKNALNNGLQNQINELTPQVDEYEELKARLQLLESSLESTGALDFSKYKAMDALDIIEQTCPTGVMLEKISNTNMTLTLDCIASDNYQIAQFALELERSGHFTNVSISGSTPADLIYDENEQATTGNARKFSLYLVYDLSYPEPETEEGEEAGEDNS